MKLLLDSSDSDRPPQHPPDRPPQHPPDRPPQHPPERSPERPLDLKRVFVLLAMRYSDVGDAERITALQRLFPTSIIYTCSDTEDSSATNHISLVFGDARGTRRLSAFLNSLVGAASIEIILDWTFLATGYYRDRYGTKWLSASPGKQSLSEQLLRGPENQPRSITMFRDLGGVMDEMLETASPALRIVPIPREQNPLWVATDLVTDGPTHPTTGRADNERIGTRHLIDHMNRLDPENPFVRVTL